MTLTILPRSADSDVRQGEYLYTEAFLWECGDPHCDCRQVVVEEVYKNAISHIAAFWRVRVAEGTYFCEGDGRTPEAEATIQEELDEGRALASDV